jgi:hypothetical protein
MRNLASVLAAVAVGLSVPAVNAQYYIQQGNMFDANTRLGSGGFNAARPGYVPNSTNRLVTGNSTGGTAFRGYSAVRDPSSFFLGAPGANGGGFNSLPSDRLYSFRRDSFAATDPRRGGYVPGQEPLPYYSQSSTVTNTGQILRGLNRPGTSQVQNNNVILRPDYRPTPTTPLDAARANALTGSPMNVDTQVVRADTGGKVNGQINARLLSSPLFGGIRQVPLSQIAAQADRPTARPTLNQERETQIERGRLEQPVEASPLDRLLRLQGSPAGEQPDQRLARPLTSPTQARPAAVPPPSGEETNLYEPTLGVSGAVLDQRYRESLAKADELMGKEQFYDAARRYDTAHAIDMKSPVPLVGRSMAYLAAGDYVSSLNDFFMAIRVGGPDRVARMDLKRLLPRETILDARRADLENRLSTIDDFRLRFLLGLSEYMSDLKPVGTANLAKAIESAPEPNRQDLRRFLEQLTAAGGSAQSAPAVPSR